MAKGSSGMGLNGLLDKGSHLKGELHFEETFKLSGKITGSVVSPGGTLEVYEPGDIDGEVHVRLALISGRVRGAIHASERIEIAATGQVHADIQTPSLILREGAIFEGRCSMKPKKASDAAKGARIPLAENA
jgi:cytoskeletal protein CcmA (bactofilin family)